MSDRWDVVRRRLAGQTTWVGRAGQLGRSALVQMRLAVPGARALPDFLVIGAQKCGTTSLFRALTRHPDVLGALFKEVRYFDLWHDRGEAWYRAHFPPARRREAGRGSSLPRIGEASPDYLHDPLVPARVRDLLSDVRLIALLRNPVDRALSHWGHQRTRGREVLSFEEALAREDERLAAGRHEHLSYRTRGLYLKQLRSWTDFFPRERLLILCSEHFFEAPQGVYARVLDFLGLPNSSTPRFRPHNVGPRAAMKPATRQQLHRFFQPHNEELFEWLGERMPWD